MKKQHKDLARRIVSLLKCEGDFESIDEIRIINDGGGTGCMHVLVREYKKKPAACSVSMHMPSTPAFEIDPVDYWEDV